MAVSTLGCAAQNRRPEVKWPERTARTRATRKPDTFVHSIDSCIEGRFGPGKDGLSCFVLSLTLSCRPPVKLQDGSGRGEFGQCAAVGEKGRREGRWA